MLRIVTVVTADLIRCTRIHVLRVERVRVRMRARVWVRVRVRVRVWVWVGCVLSLATVFGCRVPGAGRRVPGAGSRAPGVVFCVSGLLSNGLTHLRFLPGPCAQVPWLDSRRWGRR